MILQKMWLTLVAWVFRPDCVWITFPRLYFFLPPSLKRLPIVYDCMDLAQGFPDDQPEAHLIDGLENDLIRNAAAVICSSQHLHDAISGKRKTDADAKVFLVRNGLSADMLARIEPRVRANGTRRPAEHKSTLNIAYVGTVAKWLDFGGLLYCLECVDGLYLHLVGPEETERIEHDRLIYHGAIEHDLLPEYVSRFDGFILAFALTPLTRGVDPVKLYEYIAFGKEIFSIYYEEIERFRPYVHFYRSRDELCDLLNAFRDGRLLCKADSERARRFLLGSTWMRRADEVDRILRRAVGTRRL